MNGLHFIDSQHQQQISSCKNCKQSQFGISSNLVPDFDSVTIQLTSDTGNTDSVHLSDSEIRSVNSVQFQNILFTPEVCQLVSHLLDSFLIAIVAITALAVCAFVVISLQY